MPIAISRDVVLALMEQRRRNDPLRNVTLSPIQKECQQCMARFRAIVGVNRGGKTALEMMEVAMAARRIHPTRSTKVNGTYLIFAPARDQLIDPIGKKLIRESELKGPCFQRPMIPEHEIERIGYVYGAGDRVPHEIILKNGHRILLLVSGDKNVWKRVQGKGMVLGVCVDEAAGSMDLLAEASTRLLDANSHEQVQREAGGGWMLWGFTETMATPAVDHYLKLCADPDAIDFAAFRLDAASNPAISKVEREKLRDILGEDQYKIRMEGTGGVADALAVYPQWDDARHMLKEDYKINDTDNIWIGYDPGSNYTGISIWAVNRELPRTLYCVKCWETRRQTIGADVRMIMDFLKGRNIEAVVYDPAARKVEKTGESVYLQLQRKFQEAGAKIWRGLCMGRNRYEDSVPVVRYYLDPVPADKSSPPLMYFSPSKESGCQLMRAEMKGVRFKSLAHELKESGIQAGFDHLSDTLRYLAGERPCWVDRGLNKEDPNYGSRKPISDGVLDENQLREQRKMEMSARIARGDLSFLPMVGRNPRLR